jgi:hypothetical protein
VEEAELLAHPDPVLGRLAVIDAPELERRQSSSAAWLM